MLTSGPCDCCGKTRRLIETCGVSLCSDCLANSSSRRESCVLLACVLTGGLVAFAVAILWG